MQNDKGRLPFDQKFRNFRNGHKWYENFRGKVPENPEIVEFPKSKPFNPLFNDVFAADVVCARSLLLLCIKSHDVDLSVFCLLLYLWIKPRSHWKILREQLSSSTLEKDCTFCPRKFPEIRPGIFGRMVSAQSFFMIFSPQLPQRRSLDSWAPVLEVRNLLLILDMCQPRQSSNRPFPSSLVALFQSESKCETILTKMTLICMKMKLHAELSFALDLVLKQRHKWTPKWPIVASGTENTERMALMRDDIRLAKITTKPRFESANFKFYRELIPKTAEMKRIPT